MGGGGRGWPWLAWVSPNLRWTARHCRGVAAMLESMHIYSPPCPIMQASWTHQARTRTSSFSIGLIAKKLQRRAPLRNNVHTRMPHTCTYFTYRVYMMYMVVCIQYIYIYRVCIYIHYRYIFNHIHIFIHLYRHMDHVPCNSPCCELDQVGHVIIRECLLPATAY